MTEPFIVDAHVHTGYPNIFFCPEVGARELLRRMDQFSIRCSLNLGSMRNLLGADIGRNAESAAGIPGIGRAVVLLRFLRSPPRQGGPGGTGPGGRLGRLQRRQDPPLVQQGFRGGPALRAGVGVRPGPRPAHRGPYLECLQLQPRAGPVHAGQVRELRGQVPGRALRAGPLRRSRRRPAGGGAPGPEVPERVHGLRRRHLLSPVLRGPGTAKGYWPRSFLARTTPGSTTAPT